jgi:hypothetical protein
MKRIPKELGLTHEQTFLMTTLWRVVKAREQAGRWKKENPQKAQERNRRYREKHLKQCQEVDRKRTRRWHKNHRKESIEQRKRWAARYPDKVRANHKIDKQRRRARKRGNGGSFTLKEWLDLKIKYNNVCLCCGLSEEQLKPLRRKLVPDHVVPLSKGGNNSIDNIQPLCHGAGGCNNKKSTNCTDFRKENNR